MGAGGCTCLHVKLRDGNVSLGQARGDDGRLSRQRLAGSGAGLCCTDGTVIKSNKKERDLDSLQSQHINCALGPES